jgi:hypothetical protein
MKRKNTRQIARLNEELKKLLADCITAMRVCQAVLGTALAKHEERKGGDQ